jgi:hypothetical protein
MAKNRPHRHERRRQRVANSYSGVKPSPRIGSGDSLVTVKGTYRAFEGYLNHQSHLRKASYEVKTFGTNKSVDKTDIKPVPTTASEKALISRLSSLKNRRAENKTDKLITGHEPYTVRSHQVYWLPSNWSNTTKKYYLLAIIELLKTN